MDIDAEQHERDKSKRGDRPSRFSDVKQERSRDRKTKENRIYVSNVPYNYKWSDVKGLFREHVGDVAFVELFYDENEKSRGCGIVEFSNAESVKKAMEVMHRFAIQGRKLVIKEDYGNDRDKFGHVIKGNNREGHDSRINRGGIPQGPDMGPGPEHFNTFGLSAQFLESIGVNGPLFNRIFVANLDYKVDKAKLKEVFKMAGKVRNVDLSTDKEGNSRGFAVIEYDHPVEAVQAISLFDRQFLFDRKLTVRMDRATAEKSEVRLPEGLKGIGIGLGPNGEPLHDVARNIQQNTLGGLGGQASGIGAGILGAVPSAAMALNSINAGLGNSAIGATSLGNNLGLQALGLSGLGSIQNQLLQQGLGNNNLGVGSTSGLTGSGMTSNMQDMGNPPNGMMGNGNMGGGYRSGMSQNSSNYPNQQSGMNRPMGGGGNHYGSQPLMDMGRISPPNMYGQCGGRDNDMPGNNKKPMDAVHVGNLPMNMSWQQIRDKFSEAGDIKYGDKMKGGAILRFQNEWGASRAIKLFDRTNVDGRIIQVRYY